MAAVYISLGVASLLSLLAAASTWMREEYGHSVVFLILFFLTTLALSSLSWM